MPPSEAGIIIQSGSRSVSTIGLPAEDPAVIQLLHIIIIYTTLLKQAKKRIKRKENSRNDLSAKMECPKNYILHLTNTEIV